MLQILTLIIFPFLNATRGGNTFLATWLEKKKLKQASKWLCYTGCAALTIFVISGKWLWLPVITLGFYVMMVVAGSKYFPTYRDTSNEPPSLKYIGVYIEKFADKITSNLIFNKTICLSLTKLITSIPLMLTLAIASGKISFLILIPFMAIQGLAYLIGINLADKIRKPQHRLFFSEIINGLFICIIIVVGSYA